jgi:hypothetical protein
MKRPEDGLLSFWREPTPAALRCGEGCGE